MVVSSSAQVTEHERGAGSSARYNNRELSWLKFNQRVLAQAEDSALPLLERINFCAIHASNLDEFYMVRVAGLKDQLAAGVEELSADGLTPSEQLRRIGDSVDRQLATVAELFADEIGPGLSDAGIEIVGWDQLSAEERAVTDDVFERRIFPVLTPLAVDPGHPFPYISNLSLNLAVLLRHPDGEPDWFARVKVPETLQRFVNVGGYRYVPVEEIISHHLGSLFTGLDVIGGWPFRVTRNSDMSLDDEDADDLLEAVEHELRRRRFGSAVRLEVTSQAPAAILELLQAELDLDDADILPVDGILDLTALRQLHAIDRPDLKFSRSIRVAPHRLQNLDGSADIFDRIAAEDILLHHPYESFNASVTNFVRYASEDPAVQAIKVTLYRTSGDSPIVNALISAAEQGKQVAALVELKARFDEQANIAWARRLEDAGAHVVYGMVGLKTHTKVAMVVRDEPQGLRRYCHIGTGNYNPKTARLYEDVGLLTASDAIGSDLSQLFNYLTGYGVQAAYERLIVAPDSLRPKMVELIDQEIQAGTQGHLLFKMNSLVDPQLIDKLYEASAEGVRVQLVVRGICCLRPGVVGLSENITVRSIVGRYLEHSRIFFFANGNGPGEELYLFGSADLMPRNLDRRIEAMLLVDGAETKRRLREILDINLADTALAWDLDEAGEYCRLGGNVNAQQRFVQLARNRSQ